MSKTNLNILRGAKVFMRGNAYVEACANTGGEYILRVCDTRHGEPVTREYMFTRRADMERAYAREVKRID